MVTVPFRMKAIRHRLTRAFRDFEVFCKESPLRDTNYSGSFIKGVSMMDGIWLWLRFSMTVPFCAVASLVMGQALTDEAIKKLASPLVEKRIVDGLSIGFLDGDRYGTVHLGFANESKQTADIGTIYEIGSITKVFTSLLLADAVVRGEINLHAKADVANPAGIAFKTYEERAVKWVDLSTHRSGLPRLPDNLPLTSMRDPYRDYDSKKAAEFLKDFKPVRKPGSSQEYSNFGVSVLGYLLAEKAGQSYEALLRERIAEPLKMADTTLVLDDNRMKRLATPHEKFGSETPIWSFADLPGAGGIRSTMRDLMRFAKAQLQPPDGLLGDAINLAWQQHTEADNSGPAMGLGWVIMGDGQTRLHDGGTGGSTSCVLINRTLKRAVIVLCNTQSEGDVAGLAMQLMAGVPSVETKREPEKSTSVELKKPTIDAKLRSRLEGRYQLAANFIFTVKDVDGHLMVGITNQETQEVFPDSPTRWSYRGVKATLEFVLPKSGPAKSLILHQNGVKQNARRID